MLALSSMKKEYKAGWTQLWLSRQRELLISDGLAYKPLGRASRTSQFLEGKAANRYETHFACTNKHQGQVSACQISQKVLTIEKLFAPGQSHLALLKFISLIRTHSGAQQLGCPMAQYPLVTVQLEFLLASLLCQFGPQFYLQLARESD